MTADFAGSGGLAEAVGVGATGSEVVAAGSHEVAAAAAPQPPSSLFLVVSQALDSSVGTESGWVSLVRAPLVGGATDRPLGAPRPPRSVARPRPRAASGRPPRAIRLLFEAGTSAPVVVVKVSLDLALDRSFFWETSPHCEMEPVGRGQMG